MIYTALFTFYSTGNFKGIFPSGKHSILIPQKLNLHPVCFPFYKNNFTRTMCNVLFPKLSATKVLEKGPLPLPAVMKARYKKLP
jgi:predicted nucleotide-binding protein (sugar kinase/HSP70/actin superfamily)